MLAYKKQWRNRRGYYRQGQSNMVAPMGVVEIHLRAKLPQPPPPPLLAPPLKGKQIADFYAEKSLSNPIIKYLICNDDVIVTPNYIVNSAKTYNEGREPKRNLINETVLYLLGPN